MGNKLYVGNLPFSATEDSLTDTFSECGMVESIKLMMDNGGISNGFALVEMSTGSEAQDVITKFNGTDYNGQEMKINEVKPMQKRNYGRGAGKKAW